MRWFTLALVTVASCYARAAPIEDLFDLGPSNRVGISVLSDSDGGSAGSIDGTAVLPREWTLSAAARTRRLEFAGETTRSRAFFLGAASDALATWVFDFGFDRESQEDLFSDAGFSGRATWQPVGGWLNGWALFIGVGSRRFEFKKTVTAWAPKSEIALASRSLRLGMDIPLGRSWNVVFEGEKHWYPDEINEMDRDIVALLVPSDTLSYAFALPESSARVAVGWYPPFLKRRKPSITLSASGSRAAVDQSKTGSLGLDLGLEVAKGWRTTLQIGATRTLNPSGTGANSESILRSAGLHLSYSWK